MGWPRAGGGALMALQFSIPRRRKVSKLGLRDTRREFPRHRAFVRKHECSVPGCANGSIEFCHVRSAANSGTGLKPADWWGVSMCASHHAESHRVGIQTFESTYKINLSDIARRFAKMSPDKVMKEAMDAQRTN